MPFILRIKPLKILTPGVPVLGPDLRTKRLQIFASPTNAGLVYYGGKGLTAGVRRALAAGASDTHEVPQNGELDMSSLRFDAANAGDQVNLLYYQWQDAPDPAIVIPSQVFGLAGWWKADAITGLAANAPVSSWTDSSGNGKHLASTNTNRPLYQTNVQGGLPGVLFDGVNDNMDVAMTYISCTVLWASSLTKGGQILWSESDDSEDLIGAGDSPYIVTQRGGIGKFYRELASNWMNGVGVFAVRLAATVAQTVIRRDGLEVAAVGSWPSADTGAQNLVRNNFVGSRDGDNSMGGHLLEMMIYNTTLTDAQIVGVEAYLSDKWGV